MTIPTSGTCAECPAWVRLSYPNDMGECRFSPISFIQEMDERGWHQTNDYQWCYQGRLLIQEMEGEKETKREKEKVVADAVENLKGLPARYDPCRFGAERTPAKVEPESHYLLTILKSNGDLQTCQFDDSTVLPWGGLQIAVDPTTGSAEIGIGGLPRMIVDDFRLVTTIRCQRHFGKMDSEDEEHITP